ncbi:MAG: hypothetical protein ACOX6V_02985 [Patescibacteria group bacterium]|jgi:hypothetical protein
MLAAFFLFVFYLLLLISKAEERRNFPSTKEERLLPVETVAVQEVEKQMYAFQADRVRLAQMSKEPKEGDTVVVFCPSLRKNQKIARYHMPFIVGKWGKDKELIRTAQYYFLDDALAVGAKPFDTTWLCVACREFSQQKTVQAA